MPHFIEHKKLIDDSNNFYFSHLKIVIISLVLICYTMLPNCLLQLAEKQNGTELSIDKAIQELRADKIIKYFKENGGKDPVAQIMTDWFDTFELAVDDAELLPGFEKQV